MASIVNGGARLCHGATAAATAADDDDSDAQ